MGTWKYNPETATGTGPGRARATAGTYDYLVEEIEDMVFGSGNEGKKLVLSVAAFPDRNVKVFENLVFTPRALWKIEQFLTSIGLDYANPPDNDAVTGLMGSARFEVNEKGYLAVAEFLRVGVGEFKAKKPPAPVASDDVPF